MMFYDYSMEMFTRKAKPIRTFGDPDNQLPDKWRSLAYGKYSESLFGYFLYIK
jgi:hypothetical protein